MGHYRCFEPPSVLPGRAIHRSSRASRPRWAKVIDARNKICWHVKFATRRRRHAGLDDPILADRRDLSWDEGQWKRLRGALANVNEHAPTYQTEFRVHRPNGERRWCIVAVAASIDATHRVVRLGGVTVDITDRKSAEERQTLLVREVDHRARNALAVVQSIVRLTRAESTEAYIAAVEGRITALSRAHVLLSESRW